MFGKRKQTIAATIGIELCKEVVHVVIGSNREDGTVDLLTHSLTWRHAASSVHSQLGRRELAHALKEILTHHRVQGGAAYLALNGDYCVTRVVTGTTERVRRELNQVQQRSALYLSLGHGRKAVGGSVRSIDAKHDHGLLAVVNQRTLDALCEVFQQLGLRLELVEPSLVSLCRIIGRMDGDTNGPALIINLSETGTELGITHAGRPVLDYRPAVAETNEQIATVVLDHLERLQRYCSRYVPFARGKLTSAYLCGDWRAVDAVGAVLEESERLVVNGMEPTAIDPQWRFGGDVPGSELNSALGACLVGLESAAEHAGPNLMEGVITTPLAPLAWELARTIWPVAAALVVAAAAWGCNWSLHATNHRLIERIAHYAQRQADVGQLRRQIGRDQGLIAELQAIQQALPDRQWHMLAERIGQCLPDDVWLDSFNLDLEGQLTLSGASFTENGVFELIRWLQAHPQLVQVALQGTQPTRLESGPATRFDVYCALADSRDQERTQDDDG